MKKGIFAVVFIALMCVMGGTSIGTFFKLHCPEPALEEKVENIEVSATEVVNGPQSSGGLLKTVEHAKIGVEEYTKSVNPLSNPFIFFSGWLNEATQGDIILNGTVAICRLSNGYYTLPFPYSRSEESWNNLLDFTTWLNQRDIRFFHLIAADKGDDSFGSLPQGTPDGYSRMAGEYKAFLEENGIDYLEAKTKLLAQNSDFYYWFYKADHHWNVHAGLLLAQESAKKLNEIGVAADTDVVKKENFKLVIYPDSFLGSLGRALGPKHTEDMEVYYPKMESNFRVQIPQEDRIMDGDFTETLVREQNFSNKTLAYSFCHGGNPIVKIENMDAQNMTKVLLIRHSKGDVVCSYLAFAVKYLDVLDPRYYEDSIRLFIEETRPDAVIVCIDVPWNGDIESWKLK